MSKHNSRPNRGLDARTQCPSGTERPTAKPLGKDNGSSTIVDFTGVDRTRIKNIHGIETTEKIKIYSEIKHVKELWTTSNNKNVRCFWDHHPFDGIGIFCPISYRPKQVAKVDTFTIKENVPKNKDLSSFSNLVEITDAYYEVDGVFCSPECCLAYIHENKTKAGGLRYNDSERLLHFMLGYTKQITPANSYRLLIDYGGDLTIEQFRHSNKAVKYKYYGTTVLVSHLFEKSILSPE